MTKKKLIDRIEQFSKKHPFIFWGGSILWILLPPPIDFIPIVDDLILAVILSIIGIKKLQK